MRTISLRVCRIITVGAKKGPNPFRQIFIAIFLMKSQFAALYSVISHFFSHLLGHLCYEVAELLWWERKMALILFADPPFTISLRAIFLVKLHLLIELTYFYNHIFFFSGIYWDDFATKLQNYRGGSEKWPRPFLPIRQMPRWMRPKNISWRLNR